MNGLEIFTIGCFACFAAAIFILFELGRDWSRQNTVLVANQTAMLRHNRELMSLLADLVRHLDRGELFGDAFDVLRLARVPRTAEGQTIRRAARMGYQKAMCESDQATSYIVFRLDPANSHLAPH